MGKTKKSDDDNNEKKKKLELRRDRKFRKAILISNLGLELWDTIGTNIKFTIEPFKKYMSN